jgi:hypothetical protein
VVCADTEPTADSDSDSGGDEATHNVILNSGCNALFVATNVGCSQEVENLVRTTVSHYGRLDMYVQLPPVLCSFLTWTQLRKQRRYYLRPRDATTYLECRRGAVGRYTTSEFEGCVSWLQICIEANAQSRSTSEWRSRLDCQCREYLRNGRDEQLC